MGGLRGDGRRPTPGCCCARPVRRWRARARRAALRRGAAAPGRPPRGPHRPRRGAAGRAHTLPGPHRLHHSTAPPRTCQPAAQAAHGGHLGAHERGLVVLLPRLLRLRLRLAAVEEAEQHRLQAEVGEYQADGPRQPKAAPDVRQRHHGHPQRRDAGHGRRVLRVMVHGAGRRAPPSGAAAHAPGFGLLPGARLAGIAWGAPERRYTPIKTTRFPVGTGVAGGGGRRGPLGARAACARVAAVVAGHRAPPPRARARTGGGHPAAAAAAAAAAACSAAGRQAAGQGGGGQGGPASHAAVGRGGGGSRAGGEARAAAAGRRHARQQRLLAGPRAWRAEPRKPRGLRGTALRRCRHACVPEGRCVGAG